MKPLSIGRLSLFFVLTAGLLVIGLGIYFRLEITRAADEITRREREAARQEIREALATVERQIRDTGQALANWDETKQQLVFSEYYTLWRDARVRDMGMISATVRTAALYDRNGAILNGVAGRDPMPVKLPGAAPLTLFKQEQGHELVYHFLPVHADPGKTILLGYVGLKYDFWVGLRQARVLRYADLDKARLELPGDHPIDIAQAIDHLHFGLKSNQDRDAFLSLFQASQLRLTLVILVTLLCASWLLNRLLVRPLRDFSAQIDALREPGGDLARKILDAGPIPVLELENVRRSFNENQSRLSDLHDSLEQNSRDFYDQARQDALTGVCNRRAFDEDWHGLGEDRRLGRVVLMLFDCDHFKAINDSYGHHIGDSVIRAIAACLQTALRADDRLYRIGGDEFATVLREADHHNALTVAERCLEHIRIHDFQQYGMSEPVTISIGVALAEQDGVTLSALQKQADLAMYSAKRPNSSKIVFYREEMGGMASLVANREINAVFRAIQDPRLIEPRYQAVMRLPLEHKEYVEALARVRHEDTLIGAGAIFPIIQDRNLDAEFDLAVIQAVTRDMESGHLAAGQGVSINISAPGIINAKVVDALLALLRAQRERKIVVEITETALITQMATATANIRRLREAGGLVALDDFGSGYSSLRYLASMPVDLVKFDISMVHLLIEGDSRQRLMIEEIVGMVLTAGYGLVAEGVETRELLDKVISLGFSHAQGYWFGQPGEERPVSNPAPSSATAPVLD